MTTDNMQDNATGSGNEDLLARLIRHAGRRETPPADLYTRVYTAAHQTWRSRLRRRRRQVITRAAAALAVIGLTAAVYMIDTSTPSAQIATIERVIGVLESRPAVDMPWQLVGDTVTGLNRGGQLRTLAGSRASIALDSGVSLRLAGDTEVALASGSRIELRSGMLYIDTGNDALTNGGVEIITPAGVARDVGTQFEVRYLADTYRLRVREGQVLLLRSADEIVTDSGTQLLISAAGELSTARVAKDDPDWQWVQGIAPAPSIDNQPLSLLLEWVARETGRPVRFERPALEDRAAITVLHGNIQNLAPMEALGVVLATTDFDYDEMDDGTIMIRLRND